jgi:hypothetical protein
MCPPVVCELVIELALTYAGGAIGRIGVSKSGVFGKSVIENVRSKQLDNDGEPMIYPLIPLVDEGVDTLVSSNTIVGEVQVHKAYDDTEARHQVYSGNICLQGNILEDRHCRLIVNFMATRPMTPCYCLFSFFEHVVALTRSKEGALRCTNRCPIGPKIRWRLFSHLASFLQQPRMTTPKQCS